MIRKVGNSYKLVSKEKGKNLGTYSSQSGAKRREKQVELFKTLKKLKEQGKQRPVWFSSQKIWDKL